MSWRIGASVALFMVSGLVPDQAAGADKIPSSVPVPRDWENDGMALTLDGEECPSKDGQFHFDDRRRTHVELRSQDGRLQSFKPAWTGSDIVSGVHDRSVRVRLTAGRTVGRDGGRTWRRAFLDPDFATAGLALDWHPTALGLRLETLSQGADKLSFEDVSSKYHGELRRIGLNWRRAPWRSSQWRYLEVSLLAGAQYAKHSVSVSSADVTIEDTSTGWGGWLGMGVHYGLFRNVWMDAEATAQRQRLRLKRFGVDQNEFGFTMQAGVGYAI